MDGMNVVMRGVHGYVRKGYHDAVRLPTWELHGTAEGGTVTGPATEINDYWVSQRPLVFVVERATAVWRWPVVDGSLQIADQTLRASLGPCME